MPSSDDKRHVVDYVQQVFQQSLDHVDDLKYDTLGFCNMVLLLKNLNKRKRRNHSQQKHAFSCYLGNPFILINGFPPILPTNPRDLSLESSLQLNKSEISQHQANMRTEYSNKVIDRWDLSNTIIYRKCNKPPFKPALKTYLEQLSNLLRYSAT